MELKLPVSVVGPVDLGRLIREMETLDNELMQQELRAGTEVKLPKTSKLLDQTVELNKVDLLKADQRKQLQQSLTKLREKAPVLHISFSADPSPLFIEKMMTWLRAEIDPLVLLTVGEQPNIGAGCVVRTTNKYFDFSLREHFMKQRTLLMESLKVGSGTIVPPRVPAPAAVTPTAAQPGARA
jgi:F0F1-type ATP synthase delta subunit